MRLLTTSIVLSALIGCASGGDRAPATSSIGSARMANDGVIRLHLRAEVSSAVGDVELDVEPGDPRYEQIRQHVGGLQPGEEKPMPPWEKSR